MSEEKDVIYSAIWREDAEAGDQYSAERCYCHGYDVFGEVLGQADWVEYIYLLFSGKRLSDAKKALLNDLAVLLANPGPRDSSVRAAMNAGVGGSTSAACLISAIAVGAGQHGGAHEVALLIEAWQQCGMDVSRWKTLLRAEGGRVEAISDKADVWPKLDHTLGFRRNRQHGSMMVKQVMDIFLAKHRHVARHLLWLQQHQGELERDVGAGMALVCVVSAVFKDLGVTVDQAEMLYLIMRLPGAAAHALEQKKNGWSRYPFFADKLIYKDEVHKGV